MSKEEDGLENRDHLQKASVTTRLGLSGLKYGIYHYILGFSEWTKNRHIIIQAGITGGIFIALIYLANFAGNIFFTTFWEQAIYASGLRLRLLPIPLSLVIYALIIALFLLGFSLDSSIRELKSELEEVKDKIDSDIEESESEN